MGDALRLRLGRWMLPIPAAIWRRRVAADAAGLRRMLRFMTPEHHRVRDFAVTELPRAGRPLPVAEVAAGTGLPADRVAALVEELEKRLFFLFRNPAGEIAWAYPVTAEATPHHFAFESGERLNAAWAVDAFAAPFVQGHLLGRKLRGRLRTACAHCERPIEMELDSELDYRVLSEGAVPVVSSPRVDFRTLEDPSIIHAFWRRSLFFWSEEHARRHPLGVRATYPRPDQLAFLTRAIQAALFALPRNREGGP